MARRYDSTESRRLLLAASAEEFARHGIDGARIDKIAQRAGVNKASIYAYIGNKEDLFEAAVTRELGELAQRVAIRDQNLPAYVADLFDFLCENPTVVWLFEQEALHFPAHRVPLVEDRAAYFRSRVEAVAAALPATHDAASTFFSLMAMCYWYVAAPQLVHMIFGDASEAETRGRYRAHLVQTASALVEGSAVGRSAPDVSAR